MRWISVWVGVLLSACASLPPAPPSSSEFRSGDALVIVGTSDLHSSLNGISRFSSTLRSLKMKYGSRLIWLDAGDMLGGPLFDAGAEVIQWANNLGLQAAAVGDSELALPSAAWAERRQEARFPYVTANIQIPLVEKSVFLNSRGVKVAVVGATTEETRWTTSSLSDVKMESLISGVRGEIERVRGRGAQLVILLAHLPVYCERVPLNDRASSSCALHGELVDLLNALPPRYVNAVISGHAHESIAATYRHPLDRSASVPIIQAEAEGRSFSLIHLSLDSQTFRLEGPLSVTESTPLDSATENLLQSAREQTVKKGAERLFQQKRELGRKQLSQITADAALSATQADFAILHAGSVRDGLPNGTVDRRTFFRALPFPLSLSRASITGKELKELLTILQSGAREAPTVSGLKLKILDSPKPPGRSHDYNGDGRISAWEANRLKDLKTSTGKAIFRDRRYQIVMPDYLWRGGDDLEVWARKSHPLQPERFSSLQEILLTYLTANPEATGQEEPLRRRAKRVVR